MMKGLLMSNSMNLKLSNKQMIKHILLHKIQFFITKKTQIKS